MCSFTTGNVGFSLDKTKSFSTIWCLMNVTQIYLKCLSNSIPKPSHNPSYLLLTLTCLFFIKSGLYPSPLTLNLCNFSPVLLSVNVSLFYSFTAFPSLTSMVKLHISFLISSPPLSLVAYNHQPVQRSGTIFIKSLRGSV